MQKLTEGYRYEQNMLTSTILQDLEAADKSNLKTQYNYNLHREREKKEDFEEVRQEYLFAKFNPDPVTMQMQRKLEENFKYGPKLRAKKREH